MADQLWLMTRIRQEEDRIICYIQIDRHCIGVYGPEATHLMYRGINMT